MSNQYEQLTQEKIRIDKMTKRQIIGSFGYHLRCCYDCERGGQDYPCFYECIGALNYKRDKLKVVK